MKRILLALFFGLFLYQVTAQVDRTAPKYDLTRPNPKTTVEIQSMTRMVEGSEAWNTDTNTIWRYVLGFWLDTGSGGGGTTYTAGDGIDITSDEISVDTSDALFSDFARLSGGPTTQTFAQNINAFNNITASGVLEAASLRAVPRADAVAPTNGTIYYDSDTNQILGYVDGSPVDLGQSGGGSGDLWSDLVDSDIVPDGTTRRLGSLAAYFTNFYVDDITQESPGPRIEMRDTDNDNDEGFRISPESNGQDLRIDFLDDINGVTATNTINASGSPVNPNDLATKAYVDANSGSASSLTVSDNTTDVSNVTDLTIIGATLQDNGSGSAEYTIMPFELSVTANSSNANTDVQELDISGPRVSQSNLGQRTAITVGERTPAEIVGAVDSELGTGWKTGGSGSSNPNIFIPTSASDFTSPSVSNQNKTWEIQSVIDLGNASIDLSTHNIKLKDGGGQLTNFTDINLGNFSTEGNPNARYFDQSGTVTGYCTDGSVYVEWFGPNKNGHLMDNTVDPTGPAVLNGALPDHIAIQNAMRVSKDSDNNWGTIHFPPNSTLMQGDGTNPEYQSTNSYIEYEGGTANITNDVSNSATFAIDNVIGNVPVGNAVNAKGIQRGVTIVSYSAPNITLSEPVTLTGDTKLVIAGQYLGPTGAVNVLADGFSTGEIGTMQGFEFNGYATFNDATYPPVYKEGPKIYGNGCTIIAHPRQALTEDNKGFEFFGLKNVVIKDLTYDGNIIQRDPYWIMASNINRQHGIAFNLCPDPLLINVTARQAAHDGFYFGGKSFITNRLSGFGGEMLNCIAEYNYRQGLSGVNHERMTCRKTYFQYNGKLTSLRDGRYLADSPHAGVDLEQGVTSTDSEQRGQDGWIFDGCYFIDNLGSNLAIHWGAYNCIIKDNVFIDGDVFEPDDEDGYTTNNTYDNNEFINSTINADGGGTYLRGNKFFFTRIVLDGMVSNGSGSVVPREVNAQAILITDELSNYLGDNLRNDPSSLGFRSARKPIIENNHIEVSAISDALPLTDIALGRITVNAEGAIIENNTFVNAIGITSGGGDNTIVDIGSSVPVERVNNNVWHMTTRALAKWTGNVGRMRFDEENGSFYKNDIYSGYGSLSGFSLNSQNPGVEQRGGYAKFSSYQSQLDGDEAYEVFIPNDAADVKITVVGGVDLSNGIQETWFKTYDTTYRKNGNASGATESIWWFADPVVSTNPRTGNSCYKIDVAHDISGNTNTETQVLVEWFGKSGDSYDRREYYVSRNTSYAGGTFRRVYDGGKEGNTASRPTTGGVGNYTELRFGAEYLNTEANVKEYWNGSAWVN
ncbi:MAG: hypothetical protein AAF348_07460 [Bacteroidota bacterium]